MSNKQPIKYLQTDARWGKLPYGSFGTIGGSGCGPTAMAMVLSEWIDKNLMPDKVSAWSAANGGRAGGPGNDQGTYHSFFAAIGKEYGLKVERPNTSNIYGNSKAPAHDVAADAIKRGDLVIACMGKGNWTSGGHYVLLWDIQGNVAYINDPNSTAVVRTKGDYTLFRSQVKFYFIIRKPEKVSKRKAVQTEHDFTDDTMNYLDTYKYKDALYEKFLNPEGQSFSVETINFVNAYKYGTQIWSRIAEKK